MEQIDEKFSRGIIFNGQQEGEWWWSWGKDEGYNYGHYLNGREVGTWIGSELEDYDGEFLEDYRREYDQDGNLREEFVATQSGPVVTFYDNNDNEGRIVYISHPFENLYKDNTEKEKEYYKKIYDKEIYKKMDLFLFKKGKK
jgi:hypothetical protein